MDDFFKKLKDKFNVDNIVGFMKDAKVIDNNKIKEEDVRNALEKMDPNKYVNVEEITSKITDIAEQSKSTIDELRNQSNHIMTTAKSSLSVLQKPNVTDESNDDIWAIKSDVSNPFYDGFT